MDYTVRHAGQIHYRQFRPMDTTDWTEPHLRSILSGGSDVWMDCSEGVTALCKWAGLADPNGNHYNGYGFTDTLYKHLTKHYHDGRHALTGAIVIWGDYPGTHHTAMVRHADPKYGNPLLWSMGSESDPRFISLVDETRAQRGRPYTFCSIANL